VILPDDFFRLRSWARIRDPTGIPTTCGTADIVDALQEEEFAEAYKDALRAQMGDQEEVGLDVLADPHLWYDKHQGFIGSFGLYNTLRLTSTETRVATNAAI